MIANFFNKSKPINDFNIILLLIVYYFSSALLFGSAEFSVLFLVKKIGFLFCLILFLLIFKFIIEKNNLTKSNSYALLLIVMLLGTFSEAILSTVFLFSNLILLLSYRKIYSLRSGINTKLKLFDAAFWVGVSALIYSWSIFYILLLYIGIFIYQKVSFKNLMIPVIGLATPIVIYFTYNFYFDSLPIFYSRFNYSVNLDFGAYNSLKFLVPILFLMSTLLWSIIKATPKIVSISNNLKFSWNVLIYHLLISVVLIVVSPLKNGSELFYLLFPSAIIITNFLQKSTSTLIKNVVLYLFLLISVSVYFL
tara:strand:+ start:32073 stop:32996 length:924 start_codon:yes stop_codon:yes gene_type:complete